MLSFPETTQIFLWTGATDMRRQVNGLCALVQNSMKANPFSPSYFVFCNKSRRIMKVLYWDRNGFAIWYKRLEKEKFPWPRKPQEVQRLSGEQMQWLLSGLDYTHAHKPLHYERIS